MKTVLNYFRMRFSEKFHRKVVTDYWSKSPAVHGVESSKEYDFYVSELDKLIRRYVQKDIIKLLDFGAGKGEMALRFKNMSVGRGYNVVASEPFELYQQIIREKDIDLVDSNDLPDDTFDAILMNGAFYYIHPSNWWKEIKRLLKSVKDGGYLFLTDVPTVKKRYLLYKKDGIKDYIFNLLVKMTDVYQYDLGGFFVNEEIIKKWFPNTIVEDEWCNYRSHFIIKKE